MWPGWCTPRLSRRSGRSDPDGRHGGACTRREGVVPRALRGGDGAFERRGVVRRLGGAVGVLVARLVRAAERRIGVRAGVWRVLEGVVRRLWRRYLGCLRPVLRSEEEGKGESPKNVYFGHYVFDTDNEGEHLPGTRRGRPYESFETLDGEIHWRDRPRGAFSRRKVAPARGS